jgi:uncharacterized cupin superfamily protein
MSEHKEPEEKNPFVVNASNLAPEGGGDSPWSGTYKVLTPGMTDRGGKLGANETTLPPGGVTCPFHYHLREDEIFYVLRGRGVLRYGDTLQEIGPGDCISCAAGTKVAHQVANPFDEELVSLGFGDYDSHEGCVYPDAGKIFVRGVGKVGYLEKADYMHGEPSPPEIFALIEKARECGTLG